MTSEPNGPADEVASAISAYIAAVASRVAFGPLGPVPELEHRLYAAMRDSLARMATLTGRTA